MYIKIKHLVCREWRRTKTAHAVTRVTAGRDSRGSHFRT